MASRTPFPAGMRASLIAEVDPAELAVRMCEAHYGIRRPAGLTAKQALEAQVEEVRLGWLRSAHTALEYILECLRNARPHDG